MLRRMLVYKNEYIRGGGGGSTTTLSPPPSPFDNSGNRQQLRKKKKTTGVLRVSRLIAWHARYRHLFVPGRPSSDPSRNEAGDRFGEKRCAMFHRYTSYWCRLMVCWSWRRVGVRLNQPYSAPRFIAVRHMFRDHGLLTEEKRPRQ